jgi:hypothetical protein
MKITPLSRFPQGGGGKINLSPNPSPKREGLKKRIRKVPLSLGRGGFRGKGW